MSFFYGFLFSGFLLFAAACSTLEERQPPWRKGISPPEDSFFEPDEGDSGELPFLGSQLLSKMPPVELEWPVAEVELTNYFGWRKKRMHDGVDLRAPTGTVVMAAARGRVIYASRKVKGYGKMVILDHGEGWSTLYAHLSRIEVKVGDFLNKGQRLGLSGKTGKARGAHLHFELRRGADPVDPVLFFPERFKEAK